MRSGEGITQAGTDECTPQAMGRAWHLGILACLFKEASLEFCFRTSLDMYENVSAVASLSSVLYRQSNSYLMGHAPMFEILKHVPTMHQTGI